MNFIKDAAIAIYARNPRDPEFAVDRAHALAQAFCAKFGHDDESVDVANAGFEIRCATCDALLPAKPVK